MFDALLQMLRRYDMVQPGDRVTCAVSGGADSMALLWGLYLLRDKLGITLQAAHFNHGLRGEESQRDEAHVRRFCRQHDIPLTVGCGTVVAGEKGLEAAARDARYAFLQTLPGKIATAHTADDNAETVLMHLVRGTGLQGLGGIAPVRGNIIRPMLGVTRQQVLAFLEGEHVAWVTDSSNETDAFLRNRLRHHVMPLLQRENPRLSRNLSRMAQELRQDAQALEQLGRAEGELEVSDLNNLELSVKNRKILDFLHRNGVREPEREHVALVAAVAASNKPSARADLPGGVTVRRSYDRLFCTRDAAPPQTVKLELEGKAVFGDTQVLCCSAREGVHPVGQITVRSRQSGDTIRLPGGTKSLKKLFIDRKIPAYRRELVAVVADEAGVLAVEGIGYNLERTTGQTPAVEIRFLKER